LCKDFSLLKVALVNIEIMTWLVRETRAIARPCIETRVVPLHRWAHVFHAALFDETRWWRWRRWRRWR
jgi:hypothetical protein